MANTDITKETAEAFREASQRVEAFATDTQKAMTSQMEKLTRGFETATAFNQETVDAVMKSTEIAARAVEGINAELVGFSKKSFEDSVAAAKNFASSKNMTELFEKQADYAKSAMDGLMKQTIKMNEMAMAAAKSAVEPITARFTAATEVMRSFAA